jgi:hypothetical protein
MGLFLAPRTAAVESLRMEDIILKRLILSQRVFAVASVEDRFGLIKNMLVPDSLDNICVSKVE